MDAELGPRFVPGKVQEVDGTVSFTPAQIVQTDQGEIDRRHLLRMNKVLSLLHRIEIHRNGSLGRREWTE